jgi:hypothetical protein
MIVMTHRQCPIECHASRNILILDACKACRKKEMTKDLTVHKSKNPKTINDKMLIRYKKAHILSLHTKTTLFAPIL